MIKGFKEFILRGNVMDLAVALVVGLAFTAVVNALVDHLITPLIAAIFGEPNLDSVATFTINNATSRSAPSSPPCSTSCWWPRPCISSSSSR